MGVLFPVCPNKFHSFLYKDQGIPFAPVQQDHGKQHQTLVRLTILRNSVCTSDQEQSYKQNIPTSTDLGSMPVNEAGSTKERIDNCFCNPTFYSLFFSLSFFLLCQKRDIALEKLVYKFRASGFLNNLVPEPSTHN